MNFRQSIFILLYCASHFAMAENQTYVYGHWTEWAVIGPCSSTCGHGTQLLARRCRNRPCLGREIYSRQICVKAECVQTSPLSTTSSTTEILSTATKEIYTECYVDGQGVKYRGTQWRTRFGHICVQWTNLGVTYDAIRHLYEAGALGDHNYCRGRRYYPIPHCYYLKKDGFFALEECWVSICPETPKEVQTTAITTSSSIPSTNTITSPSKVPSFEFSDEFFTTEALEISKTTVMKTTAANPAHTYNCYEQGASHNYRGKVSITKSGLPCKMWTDLETDIQILFAPLFDEGILGRHNYCRSHDPDMNPLCFTDAHTYDIEECNIPICGEASSAASPTSKVEETYSTPTKAETSAVQLEDDCYRPGQAVRYRGTVAHTKDGIECRSWSFLSLNPDILLLLRQGADGLGNHSYCRSPSNCEAPWCFTTDPRVPWDYCDVPKCTTETTSTFPSFAVDSSTITIATTSANPMECYTPGQALRYNGTMSSTEKNNSCLIWRSVLNTLLHMESPIDIAYKNLGNHSYCRSIDDYERPWCFIDSPNHLWEYCDIPVCVVTTVAPASSTLVPEQPVSTTLVPEQSTTTLVSELPASAKLVSEQLTSTTLGAEKSTLASWQPTASPEATTSVAECYDSDPSTYRGTTNVTETEIPCQTWDSRVPHYHPYTSLNYPSGGLGDHNYCRNPDGDPRLWCITTDDAILWQYCSVPQCPDITTQELKTKEPFDIMAPPSTKPMLHSMANSTTAYSQSTSASRETVFTTKPNETTEQKILTTPFEVEEELITFHKKEFTTKEASGMGLSTSKQNPMDSIALQTLSAEIEITTETEKMFTESITISLPLAIDCYNASNPSTYIGRVNVTIDGTPCQNWKDVPPFSHLFASGNYETLGLGDHNFCRSPNGAEVPWCYTDHKGTFDACDVTKCPEVKTTDSTPMKSSPATDFALSLSVLSTETTEAEIVTTPPITTAAPTNSITSAIEEAATTPYTEATSTVIDCYQPLHPTKYFGQTSITKSGIPCQPWDSDIPHEHAFASKYYPEAGLEGHNYCRNPDGASRPWCYTIDPELRWDYCNIEICPNATITTPTTTPCPTKAPTTEQTVAECYDPDNPASYRGTQGTTASGISCQPWDSLSPHFHTFTSSLLSVSGLGKHNYCRSPMNRSEPWCFTTDPAVRSAYCKVPKCSELVASSTPAPRKLTTMMPNREDDPSTVTTKSETSVSLKATTIFATKQPLSTSVEKTSTSGLELLSSTSLMNASTISEPKFSPTEASTIVETTLPPTSSLEATTTTERTPPSLTTTTTPLPPPVTTTTPTTAPSHCDADWLNHIENQTCGAPIVRNRVPRIIGGALAYPGSIPWQVSLRYRDNNTHFGGASIIVNSWIISAAHFFTETFNQSSDFSVFTPSRYYGYVGKILKYEKEVTERKIQFQLICIHEKFIRETLENDIALVKLTEPLEYNFFIRPVCLPCSTERFSDVVFASGWGDTHDTGTSSVLRHIALTYLNKNSCLHYYPELHNGSICAYDESMGKGTCVGDGGGPLTTLNRDGNFELVGIISWGFGCARPDKPGVYVDVVLYMKWILNIVKNF